MGPLLQRIQNPLKKVRKKFEGTELAEADLFRESLHLLAEALKFSVIPAIVLEFLTHLRLLTSEKYGPEMADNLVMGVWFLRGFCPCLLSELNTRNVLPIPKPKSEGEARFQEEGKLLIKAFLRKLANAPLNVEFEPTGSLAGIFPAEYPVRTSLSHVVTESISQSQSIDGSLTPEASEWTESSEASLSEGAPARQLSVGRETPPNVNQRPPKKEEKKVKKLKERHQQKPKLLKVKSARDEHELPF